MYTFMKGENFKKTVNISSVTDSFREYHLESSKDILTLC